MAKHNIFDVILKTITDVQQKNEADPKETTAHPNVFDLIKDKLGNLDKNMKNKQAQKGKKPSSIFDLIKGQLEAAKQHNQQDPNTPTAPDSIFDRIKKEIDNRPKKAANEGIQRIVEEYNLDISGLSQRALQQIQEQYTNDLKSMNHKYAQAIHDLVERS